MRQSAARSNSGRASAALSFPVRPRKQALGPARRETRFRRRATPPPDLWISASLRGRAASAGPATHPSPKAARSGIIRTLLGSPACLRHLLAKNIRAPPPYAPVRSVFPQPAKQPPRSKSIAGILSRPTNEPLAEYPAPRHNLRLRPVACTDRRGVRCSERGAVR